MTTDEMTTMIHRKREQLEEKIRNDRAEEAAMRERLTQDVLAMRERIENIIRIGNALKEEGFLYGDSRSVVDKDTRLHRYGYDGGMVADGFYHHVGFMSGYRDGRKLPVKSVGIRMGGACGCYDFYTDGATIRSVHENGQKTQPVPVNHIRQFLREFPKFESALYAWIEANMN